MKSFVYTVVAATIAASGAVANSTDASTSGTVPAHDQTNFCEFLDVTDGKMEYSPGYSWDTLNPGHWQNRAGFWKSDRLAPALMKVRTRGAYMISVLGGTKVINRTDKTEYPVLVDFSTPNPSIPGDLPQLAWNTGTTGIQNLYPEALEGVEAGIFGMGARYGQSYIEQSYHSVYTSKDQPNWGATEQGQRWNRTMESNPNVRVPEEWVNSTTSPEIHDQYNAYLRFTNFDAFGVEEPNLVHAVDLAIHGVAYMLDSEGKVKYEDDGEGRRIGHSPSYPNGKMAISYYGMTDGDYYIEHTVQCLQ